MVKYFKDILIGEYFKFKENLYMKCPKVTTSFGSDIYIANAICLKHNNPETYGKVGEFVKFSELSEVETNDNLNLTIEDGNHKLTFKYLKTGESFITLGNKKPGEEFLYEKIEIIGRHENTLNLIDMTIFQTLDDTEVIRYDD